MTQHEIIEMARPTEWLGNVEGWTFNTYQQLEAFAKLVAAKEREACAELCESTYPTFQSGWLPCFDTAAECAEAIRARGTNE